MPLRSLPLVYIWQFFIFLVRQTFCRYFRWHNHAIAFARHGWWLFDAIGIYLAIRLNRLA